jgi:hypothetical protein
MQSYDPQQTDTSQSDFLPVTRDWSTFGDTYPIIVVQETDGPTLPNSGNTNYNGLQGDGSGPNQYTIYPINVSVQAVELEGTGSYLNGTSAREIIHDIYQEVHHQIQNNVGDAIGEALFVGMTPATVTRNTEETTSGSTLEWYQRAGTINMGVINEP